MSSIEPRSADEPLATTPPEPSDTDAGATSGPTSDSLNEDALSRSTPSKHTRISGYWTAVTVGLVVLMVLMIFILENGQRAEVTFFGAQTHLPQGVALLLAAVIGGLIVGLVGAARILPLRSQATRVSRETSRRRR